MGTLHRATGVPRGTKYAGTDKVMKQIFYLLAQAVGRCSQVVADHNQKLEHHRTDKDPSYESLD